MENNRLADTVNDQYTGPMQVQTLGSDVQQQLGAYPDQQLGNYEPGTPTPIPA